MKIRPRYVCPRDGVVCSSFVDFNSTGRSIAVSGDLTEARFGLDGTYFNLRGSQNGCLYLDHCNDFTVDEKLEILDHIINVCNSRKKELLIEKLAGI
jgi:hypothetical protein